MVESIFVGADRGPGKARLVLGGVSDEKDDKNSGAGADAGISDAVAPAKRIHQKYPP